MLCLDNCLYLVTAQNIQLAIDGNNKDYHDSIELFKVH